VLLLRSLARSAAGACPSRRIPPTAGVRCRWGIPAKAVRGSQALDFSERNALRPIDRSHAMTRRGGCRSASIERGNEGEAAVRQERRKEETGSGQLPASLEASPRSVRSCQSPACCDSGGSPGELGDEERNRGRPDRVHASLEKRVRAKRSGTGAGCARSHAKTWLSLISTLVIRLPFLLRVTNARMRIRTASPRRCYVTRLAVRPMLD